jgi:hypothetical protein
MNDLDQHDRDVPTSQTLPPQQPKESQMLPAWLFLAAKLAIELKPAIAHLIKRYLSKR